MVTVSTEALCGSSTIVTGSIKALGRISTSSRLITRAVTIKIEGNERINAGVSEPNGYSRPLHRMLTNKWQSLLDCMFDVVNQFKSAPTILSHNMPLQ